MCIRISEVRQTEKDKYGMIVLYAKSKTQQTSEYNKKEADSQIQKQTNGCHWVGEIEEWGSGR